jgi:putative ATP-binding cassette transporter
MRLGGHANKQADSQGKRHRNQELGLLAGFEQNGEEPHEVGEKGQQAFIAKRVMAADYRHLELLGPARIQSALAEHCTHVAEFFVGFPIILTNAAIIAGCLIYMACSLGRCFCWLSSSSGSGRWAIIWRICARRHLGAAAQEQDRLFGYLRSLTDGAKELRLNRDKRRTFYGRRIRIRYSRKCPIATSFPNSVTWKRLYW